MDANDHSTKIAAENAKNAVNAENAKNDGERKSTETKESQNDKDKVENSEENSEKVTKEISENGDEKDKTEPEFEEKKSDGKNFNQTTVWKYQNFSVKSVLENVEVLKLPFFAILGALNFVILKNFSFEKVQKYKKLIFRASKCEKIIDIAFF